MLYTGAYINANAVVALQYVPYPDEKDLPVIPGNQFIKFLQHFSQVFYKHKSQAVRAKHIEHVLSFQIINYFSRSITAVIKPEFLI